MLLVEQLSVTVMSCDLRGSSENSIYELLVACGARASRHAMSLQSDACRSILD